MAQQFSYKRNNEKAEHNAHHDTIFIRFKGEVIAEVWGENEDKAAFIVRACNSHDELVEVLEQINRGVLERVVDIPYGAVNRIRSILAKAKGE